MMTKINSGKIIVASAQENRTEVHLGEGREGHPLSNLDSGAALVPPDQGSRKIYTADLVQPAGLVT